MRSKTLLRVGAAGTVLAAICCFTPILGIGLGALGLSAWLGWLDYLLLPTLAAFAGLTGYALWKTRRLSTHSTITCPRCGHQSTERMPRDACQFFYDCQGCGYLLRPKEGDCCVFCSYGTVPCPPIQAAGGRARG